MVLHVADPNPLLATMTGTTGALVAIVGGLLVARFVGLDSEQQGAQRQLNDADARLRIARKRRDEAQLQLDRHDAQEFLDDPNVLDALLAGETTLDGLRRHSEPVTLTDDQLRPLVDQVRAELRAAYDTIQRVLPRDTTIPADEWAPHREWQDFVRSFSGVPNTEYSTIWHHALNAVIDERIEDRRRTGEMDQREEMAASMPAPSDLRSDFGVAERRRDERRAALERAEQRVEDLEDEVARLRQIRDAVVKPSKQLWVGLLVLAYPTIVGIVLPVLAMAGGPTDFTGGIGALVVLFITGLVGLLAYLTYFAARVSRRGRGGDLDTD